MNKFLYILLKKIDKKSCSKFKFVVTTLNSLAIDQTNFLPKRIENEEVSDFYTSLGLTERESYIVDLLNLIIDLINNSKNVYQRTSIRHEFIGLGLPETLKTLRRIFKQNETIIERIEMYNSVINRDKLDHPDSLEIFNAVLFQVNFELKFLSTYG